MSSQVQVVNQALILIGADEIMSIDEASTQARKAKQIWHDIVESVQRCHPWKCCLARASLAMLTSTPAFGYAFQYQLPSNPYCLRVLEMDSPELRFTVEGRLLLTDEETANILYIAKVEDVTQWDALLRRAVSCLIASDLAYSIAQSAKLAETRYALFKEALRDARTINAQEGSPPEPDMTSSWLSARY
jgi:hypothetical protein